MWSWSFFFFFLASLSLLLLSSAATEVGLTHVGSCSQDSSFFLGFVSITIAIALFFLMADRSGQDDAVAPETTTPMVPEKGETAVRMMMMTTTATNESRRRLGSFQVCSACTCCGAKGYCLLSPCCYAINCNLPNRPFGFCSFTPKACNCFGCHL